MAYSQELADRIRTVLKSNKNITEKPMFGGLSFLYKGKMSVGVLADILVVRVGKDNHFEALERPQTRPMDFTGRPMKGFIYVDPPGYMDDKDLKLWIEDGLTFAKSLTK